MIEKKTSDEISFTEPTNKVWVSQESLIKLIDSWKTGEQLKNKGFTKDAILFSAHVIMDFKDYLFEELKGEKE